MMSRCTPSRGRRDARDQDAHNDGEDRDDSAQDMEQEQEADHADDGELLCQAGPQAVDDPVNQCRSVVCDLDGDSFRELRPQLLEPTGDAPHNLPGVRAVPDDDDRSYGFALPVPLGQAPPDLRADLDSRDVAQQHRRAVPVGAEGHLADVVDGFDVAPAADHEFLLCQLNEPSAHIPVAALHGLLDAGDRDAVGPQLQRVNRDLVLAHETADRRDFGDARDSGQLKPEEPVLERAQFAQVMAI